MAATTDSEQVQQLRRELEDEREQLASSLEALRGATDIGAKLRPKLVLTTVGAFALAFVASTGGIGAVMRLLARRGGESRTVLRLGRFALALRSVPAAGSGSPPARSSPSGVAIGASQRQPPAASGART
jgi:hypothetical protein